MTRPRLAVALAGLLLAAGCTASPLDGSIRNKFVASGYKSCVAKVDESERLKDVDTGITHAFCRCQMEYVANHADAYQLATLVTDHLAGQEPPWVTPMVKQGTAYCKDNYAKFPPRPPAPDEPPYPTPDQGS